MTGVCARSPQHHVAVEQAHRSERRVLDAEIVLGEGAVDHGLRELLCVPASVRKLLDCRVGKDSGRERGGPPNLLNLLPHVLALVNQALGPALGVLDVNLGQEVRLVGLGEGLVFLGHSEVHGVGGIVPEHFDAPDVPARLLELLVGVGLAAPELLLRAQLVSELEAVLYEPASERW